MATAGTLMTAKELLALPENGHDRWLIDGELRERPMPTRNRFHSYTMTRTARFLDTWRDSQPPPHGKVLTGDAGVRLRRNPDTVFGIDIVYASAELLARQTVSSTIIDGAPTLAVEILSPSDTIEDISDKIDALLQAGVLLVWIIDPFHRTVIVHSPGAEPVLFNSQQDLSGDPHLPGFRVPVRMLFE